MQLDPACSSDDQDQLEDAIKQKLQDLKEGSELENEIWLKLGELQCFPQDEVKSKVCY